jgi:hypothetical protein
MAADSIKPLVRSGDALTRALNEAGWLPSEVKGATILRQGHAPSFLATTLSFGLAVLKPRASKALPRTFVLAVTESQVSALKARGVTVDETDYYVTIWRDEVQSWPRAQVAMEPAKGGIEDNVTIRIEGIPEAIPCAVQAKETLGAVIAELGTRAGPADT